MDIFKSFTNLFTPRKRVNAYNKILENWSNDVKYIEFPNSRVPMASLENPDGVFTCETIECYFETKRYIGNNIPDYIPCPLCGYNMVNAGLDVARSELLAKLRGAGAGNPMGYKYAVEAWQLFVRIYSAEKAKNWKYELAELDYIFDVISKVPLHDTENILAADLKILNLDKYLYNEFEYCLELQRIAIKFINTYINDIPQKQVELVVLLHKEMQQLLKNHPKIGPSYSDMTWYFYVWRQFGLVKCFKQGRYNMIFK